MSVGSKVILLLLAVGLQSLFNGESVGFAYAKPNPSMTVEVSHNKGQNYDLLVEHLADILKQKSDGSKTILDQNNVQESHSDGIINVGSELLMLDNDNNGGDAANSGPGAFVLGTGNTFQTSHSNMTTNMGARVTYTRNTNNQ